MFAGSFLLADRDFNQAVDDYCGIVGLPPGLLENVTDRTNAFLVAIDADGRLLATECPRSSTSPGPIASARFS